MGLQQNESRESKTANHCTCFLNFKILGEIKYLEPALAARNELPGVSLQVTTTWMHVTSVPKHKQLNKRVGLVVKN